MKLCSCIMKSNYFRVLDNSLIIQKRNFSWKSWKEMMPEWTEVFFTWYYGDTKVLVLNCVFIFNWTLKIASKAANITELTKSMWKYSLATMELLKWIIFNNVGEVVLTWLKWGFGRKQNLLNSQFYGAEKQQGFLRIRRKL